MAAACGATDSCPHGRNYELNAALHRAFCRVRSWRKPPNWSAHDWLDEIKAITAAAGCHAENDYDAERHVPLSAFLYQRALACAWTRYRQEWAFFLRFMEQSPNNGDKSEGAHRSVLEVASLKDSLQCALTELSQADQWLIKQMFWNETTEDQVAKSLNISQQAVSKRKRRIIGRLRRLLGNIGGEILACEILLWSAVGLAI